MRTLIKEYSNRFAAAEKMSDGTFDLYNNVTGLFVRTVKTWDEAKGHLSDTYCYYDAIENNGFVSINYGGES
jgi:hypothetical protein|tara:strand:- start:546 stop:761 length:216 start_codon:yes stop_codon:yes gene_type:complete